MKRGDRRKEILIVFIVALFVLLVIAFTIFPFRGTGNFFKEIFVLKDSSSVKDQVQIIEVPDVNEGGTNFGIAVNAYEVESGSAYNTFLSSTNPPGVTDYYGTIKINGNNAPAGTKIRAIPESSFVCGEFTVTEASPGIGWYGFLHCVCGGDNPTCDGEIVNFEVMLVGESIYRPAKIIGNTVWDETIKRVDLEIVTQCSNGVAFNTCESTRPWYCEETGPNQGKRIERCDLCGCPAPIRNVNYPNGPKYYYYVCCPSVGGSEERYCSLDKNVRYDEQGNLICPYRIAQQELDVDPDGRNVQ